MAAKYLDAWLGADWARVGRMAGGGGEQGGAQWSGGCAEKIGQRDFCTHAADLKMGYFAGERRTDRHWRAHRHAPHGAPIRAVHCALSVSYLLRRAASRREPSGVVSVRASAAVTAVG